MAIARDTSVGLQLGSTSITYSYTNNGNALVCFVSTDGTISSVTFNGVAMTQLEHTTTDYEANSYLFTLYPASTGTANIVVTGSGSTSIISWCASYSGVQGIGNHSSNHTAGTSLTVSVATAYASDWIAGAVRSNGTPTLTGGITNVQSPNSNTENVDTNGAVSVGTYNVGFTSGGRGCVLAVVLVGQSAVNPARGMFSLVEKA